MEASQENRQSTPGPDPTEEKGFPYFRRLWKSIVVALLAASLIPMLLIGGGMYYYAISSIRENTLQGLEQEVSEHREAIDDFLSERTMDLRLLASNLGLQLTSPGKLEKAFQSLQEHVPCFTDLGIIDDQGNHLAYVGPYDLISRNYRDAEWFRAMRDRDVYISDVFTGFRKEPHFVIAVKQGTKEGFWIIRATMDAAYFDRLVTRLVADRRGDVFLVNREGVFQTTPRTGGAIMGQSQLKDLQPFPGVRLQERGQEILSMAWLQKADWLIAARFDPQEIYRPLRKARNLAIFAVLLGGVIIVGTVLLTTNYLIRRLEKKRRSIRVLDQQLQHSSKMASSVQLAPGIIREMNDTLSNIDLVASWLVDLSHRNLRNEENLNELRESLGQIKQEVARARKTTGKLATAIRRNVPVIREVALNDLLDGILELLERELHFNRIDVHRDYQDPLPLIRSDPSLLRQVFQNLLLNAVTAIRREGRIDLTTRGDDQTVTVRVADTGPGVSPGMKEKIFDPLYAAGPDGAGIGLSVGAGMLRKLGGRISVESEPGKGAVFTVDLPSRFTPTKE